MPKYTLTLTQKATDSNFTLTLILPLPLFHPGPNSTIFQKLDGLRKWVVLKSTNIRTYISLGHSESIGV